MLGEMQFENLVPDFASASKWGVFNCEFSYPMQSARCWSVVINKMFGRFFIVQLGVTGLGLRFYTRCANFWNAVCIQCDANISGFHIEIETPIATIATDTTVFHAAKWRGQIS